MYLPGDSSKLKAYAVVESLGKCTPMLLCQMSLPAAACSSPAGLRCPPETLAETYTSTARAMPLAAAAEEPGAAAPMKANKKLQTNSAAIAA